MYFLPSFKRGIFNRYRKGMPWSEMLVKDLEYAGYNLSRKLSGKPAFTLLVYPHYPSRGSTIYKLARALGWQVSNSIARVSSLAMYWEYATIRREFGALEDLKNVRVINEGSRNISKDFVDECMHESFGYGTRLDPKMHQGIAVRKSLTNAVHDGTTVVCPCAPENGFIYQKLIDSSVSESEVLDLRIPIVGNRIPFLYLNYRPISERFKNVPNRAELCETIERYLTSEEQQKIIAFCNRAGIEFGELDALRDKDGLLYVVDANNTPQGPPKHLPSNLKRKAIASLAHCFSDVFEPF